MREIIQENIYMWNGAIIHESILGDVSYLMPFIEDNIFEENGEEFINWHGVWNDYDGSLKTSEGKDGER